MTAKRICGWCKGFLGHKDDLAGNHIQGYGIPAPMVIETHGICEECQRKLMVEMQMQDRYLEESYEYYLKERDIAGMKVKK